MLPGRWTGMLSSFILKLRDYSGVWQVNHQNPVIQYMQKKQQMKREDEEYRGREVEKCRGRTGQKIESCIQKTFDDSPGLFSIFLPRLPHSRTLDISISICFWQSDLLLLGHGLRLLAICRLAWGSFTSLRWRMRELARAAIFLAPHQSVAARWRPGVGGYRGPPPCQLTQGDGAPLREGYRVQVSEDFWGLSTVMVRGEKQDEMGSR